MSLHTTDLTPKKLGRLNAGSGWMNTPIYKLKDLPLGSSTTFRRESLEPRDVVQPPTVCTPQANADPLGIPN